MASTIIHGLNPMGPKATRYFVGPKGTSQPVPVPQLLRRHQRQLSLPEQSFQIAHPPESQRRKKAGINLGVRIIYQTSQLDGSMALYQTSLKR